MKPRIGIVHSVANVTAQVPHPVIVVGTVDQSQQRGPRSVAALLLCVFTRDHAYRTADQQGYVTRIALQVLNDISAERLLGNIEQIDTGNLMIHEGFSM